MTASTLNHTLALNGGEKLIQNKDKELFHWPIITKEDEDAVLDVMRKGTFSHTALTSEFEKEMAAWQKTKHALAYCNGTASLLGALFGCKVGAGDEVITPAYTYWATFMPIINLRATPVFADIDPKTLCIDPADIEKKITPKTKAIMVMHAFGHPCDMDPIMAIAEKHQIKVIEDASHAQGSLYKGRMVGSLGHVSGMSMMGGKSFAVGEGGMLLTDDEEILQRAASFGFYEKTVGTNWSKEGDLITEPELLPWKGMSAGGFKHRMNQTCSAMGRVQLKYYPERIKEIQESMNYFWDLLKDTPCLTIHKIDPKTNSTMGGWYNAVGIYHAEELGGLSSQKFCEAVQAEGGILSVGPKQYARSHLHPLVQDADVYNEGKPSVIAFSDRDTRLKKGDLPITESMEEKVITVPWFKKLKPDLIKQYADAIKKVAENYQELL